MSKVNHLFIYSIRISAMIVEQNAPVGRLMPHMAACNVEFLGTQVPASPSHRECFHVSG